MGGLRPTALFLSSGEGCSDDEIKGRVDSPQSNALIASEQC